MMDREREARIRRILVALDASPHSLSALEAAAELAAQLQAELLGLFVEDVNLLRMAQLPFSREMGSLSPQSRSLDTPYVERQLRTRARRARRDLARLAERSQVPWSFRVARGAIAAELLAAAAEADLTILGKAGWSRTGLRRVGSTAREVVIQTDRLTMVLQRGARLGLPVLVVYDGSPVAQKALAAATLLMHGRQGKLTVLTVADTEPDAQELQTQVAEWMQERGLEARYLWLTEATVATLTHLVHAEGCQLLVVPSLSPELQDEALQSLLERLDCPVLFVR